MKQIYLVLIACCLALPHSLLGQYGGKAILPLEDAREVSVRELKQQQTNRAILCGIDTVQYPLFKAFDAPNPTEIDLFGIKDPGYSKLGQFYPAPDTMLFDGVDFFARATGLNLAPMSIKVYLAGPDSLPLGGPLVDVSFDLVPDTVLRAFSLGLANPVIIPDDYIVSIETTGPDSVYIACSEWTIGEGDGEWLGNAGGGTFWQRGYDVLIGTDRFDGDVILMPHVAYIVDFDQTVDPQCIAPGNEITFQSSISSIFTSPFYNRFYNPYSSFFSPDSNFIWYFGDGDSSFLPNPTHTYEFMAPLPDSVDIELTGLHLGYSFLCPDGETFRYEVLPAAEAMFTVDDTTSNDTFTFAYQGTGETWYWNFGDGSPLVFDDSMPSHTYGTFGNYTVRLIVTSCATMDTLDFPVSYQRNTSVYELDASTWQVFPNPGKDHFSLQTADYQGLVALKLLDMQGRSIWRSEEEISTGSELKLNWEALPAGMYWLQINTASQQFGLSLIQK